MTFFDEGSKAVLTFIVDVARGNEDIALVWIPEINYTLRVPQSALSFIPLSPIKEETNG